MSLNRTECLGYNIRCPDGNFRHLPYHNAADAHFDCEAINRKGCKLEVDGSPSTCPQGPHEVVPVSFAHPSSKRARRTFEPLDHPDEDGP